MEQLVDTLRAASGRRSCAIRRSAAAFRALRQRRARPIRRRRSCASAASAARRLAGRRPQPAAPAASGRRDVGARGRAPPTCPRDGGITVAHGDAQIAVFHFASRGAWYATQAMCPHRSDMVLGRGLLGTQGDDAEGRVPAAQEDVLAGDRRRAQRSALPAADLPGRGARRRRVGADAAGGYAGDAGVPSAASRQHARCDAVSERRARGAGARLGDAACGDRRCSWRARAGSALGGGAPPRPCALRLSRRDDRRRRRHGVAGERASGAGPRRPSTRARSLTALRSPRRLRARPGAARPATSAAQSFIAAARAPAGSRTCCCRSARSRASPSPCRSSSAGCTSPPTARPHYRARRSSRCRRGRIRARRCRSRGSCSTVSASPASRSRSAPRYFLVLALRAASPARR